MSENVYFDHNATTPLDPRVLDAMLPWLAGGHGNPSSAHRCGREARLAVEAAREQVAALLGAHPDEVVFTSSGSEANNAVIYSAVQMYGCDDESDPGHLIVSMLEHPSVRQAAARAEELGWQVTTLAPEPDGVIAVENVRRALRDDTRLVCLARASSELGTLQPVAEVAALCRRRGVPVHCDAVQAVGKVAVDAGELGVDYLTLGGHKFCGPPGIGALWIRSGAAFEPLLVGGGHESGRRASTENVPAAVGLGRTAELAAAELEEHHRHLSTLREACEDGLAAIPGPIVHCREAPRLPHTCHVAFPGVSGHELLLALDHRGYAVSTGSACHAGRPQPSQVLLAMGMSEAEALASLRVSFGVSNTRAEVERFLPVLAAEVETLQARDT